MCFGRKPKLKEPKMQAPIQNTAPPIENQTPKVVDGADTADANRNAKKRANPDSSLSLFQIQLMPGATSMTADEPGAGGVSEV